MDPEASTNKAEDVNNEKTESPYVKEVSSLSDQDIANRIAGLIEIRHYAQDGRLSGMAEKDKASADSLLEEIKILEAEQEKRGRKASPQRPPLWDSPSRR